MAEGDGTELPADQPIEAPVALPTITTAAAWRAALRRRWIVTLPSGTTVKVRALDVGSLIQEGTIDSERLLILREPTNDPAELKRRADFARELCCYIVTEPPVALSPESASDEVMLAADVSTTDALALLGWAMGQHGQLRNVVEAPVEG